MANREVRDQSLFLRTIRALLVFVLWLHVRAISALIKIQNTKQLTHPSRIPAPPPALPVLGYSIPER